MTMMTRMIEPSASTAAPSQSASILHSLQLMSEGRAETLQAERWRLCPGPLALSPAPPLLLPPPILLEPRHQQLQMQQPP